MKVLIVATEGTADASLFRQPAKSYLLISQDLAHKTCLISSSLISSQGGAKEQESEPAEIYLKFDKLCA